MKSAAGYGLAVAAGLVVFGLLVPVHVFGLLVPEHGPHGLPRQCFSVIGYGVPCADWFAITVGVAATLVVAAVFWPWNRRATNPRSD